MAKTSGSIRGNKYPKEISLDEYLGKRGLRSPISDYMDDKWRSVRMTARGRKNLNERPRLLVMNIAKDVLLP